MLNKGTTLFAAKSAIVLAFALGALNAGGCSSDDETDTNVGPSTGTGGGNGATGATGTGATGTGGQVGTGATGTGGDGTGGAGGGTTTPAPVQNDDGSWTCTDATGTHTCQCSDGIDNDNDQTIDTLDPNCINGPYDDSEAGTGTTGNCGETQCSNCTDDDGDGLVDGADIECTGALDNEENSFATGISGDNSDACKQDCFFDGNSGSGNDGCLWDLSCDPESPGQYAEKECPYDPGNNCDSQHQTDECIAFCAQYTPNGCDCFGCCTVIVEGVPHDVKLLPSCSADVIDDATLCPTCTKEPSCNNTCEECEYCLGQVPDPSCSIGLPQPEGGVPPQDAAPPPMQCPAGITACTPGVADSCPGGYYCLTGCCIPSIM